MTTSPTGRAPSPIWAANQGLVETIRSAVADVNVEIGSTGGGCEAISVTRAGGTTRLQITDGDAALPLDEHGVYSYGLFVGVYDEQGGHLVSKREWTEVAKYSTATLTTSLLDAITEWFADVALSERYTASPGAVTIAADQMKAEILADIESGRVPPTVSTFSELHDYVDANEYGGMCDPTQHASWSNESVCAVQDIVHAWLVAGRP